jgi:predicted transcriptional regulator
MNVIYDNQVNRFTTLFALYISSGGSSEVAKNMKNLADYNGIVSREFRKVFSYLVEEELIKRHDSEEESYFGSLTHKGIKAIEEVFIDPFEKTYYFPPYAEMKS